MLTKDSGADGCALHLRALIISDHGNGYGSENVHWQSNSSPSPVSTVLTNKTQAQARTATGHDPKGGRTMEDEQQVVVVPHRASHDAIWRCHGSRPGVMASPSAASRLCPDGSARTLAMHAHALTCLSFQSSAERPLLQTDGRQPDKSASQQSPSRYAAPQQQQQQHLLTLSRSPSRLPHPLLAVASSTLRALPSSLLALLAPFARVHTADHRSANNSP